MSLVPDDELAKLVREEPAGARDRKEEAPGVDHPALGQAMAVLEQKEETAAAAAAVEAVG